MSWTRFFRRSGWDHERARELQSYLDMETDENIARGMSAEQARSAAHRKLGNATLIREEIYRMNSIGFLEILWHDLRFGLRMMAKSPTFTAAAVLTLALGIGANTAIFSVVNATLIRPLPYPNASRLVMVWETRLPDKDQQNVTSPATFLKWQDDNTVFQQIAAMFNGNSILTGGDQPEQASVQMVTPNLFSMLGVNAAMGRVFLPSQEKADADQVAILSFELWQRRYGSNPNILGSKIIVDDQPLTVVGVMARGFQFFIKQQSFSQKQPEMWVPLTFSEKSRQRHGRYLQAVGLLRPGVTLSQAQASMNGLATRLQAEDPSSIMKGWDVNLVPLRTQLVGAVEPGLKLLLVAVGLVLLIACANVATLFLARATARRQEIAVRIALGATTTRVVRQILTESCLISLSGGIAGLLFAFVSTRALKALAPANLIPLEGVSVDARVLGFTTLLALLTGLLFGSLPAMQAARIAPREPIQEGSRGTAGGVRRSRARSFFVVAQIALALILLTGSGLLIRSFTRLMAVDPGFKADNVLTAWIQLPNGKYQDDARKNQFFAQLLTSLRQLPGVRSASADAFLPFAGIIAGTGVDVEGRPKLPEAEQPVIDIALIEPQFFETMGIPILQGRSFTDREGTEVSHKAVISQAMAQKLWPNENPIGKRVTIYMKRENVPSEVIGVVGDVKHAGLDADIHPTAYWPYPELSFTFMSLVVRTDGDPLAIAPDLRQAVLSLDKDQPVADIRSMDELMSASLARTRFATLCMAAFAGMALLLAVLGIYAVVTYNVEERTREIGIRVALGASRNGILRMMLRQGMTLGAVGIVIGTALSLALTRLLAKLLFGTRTTDPATFFCVVLILGGVALAGCYLAARRATVVDPITALRYE